MKQAWYQEESIVKQIGKGILLAEIKNQIDNRYLTKEYKGRVWAKDTYKNKKCISAPIKKMIQTHIQILEKEGYLVSRKELNEHWYAINERKINELLEK